MRCKTLAITVLIFALVGCGREEEEVYVEPHVPISTQADDYELGEITIKSLGDYTGYVDINSNRVHVHPYYDLEEYMVFEVMDISDQDWWEYWTRDYDRIDCGDFELFQTEVGITYGFMKLSDDRALYCYTDCLPLGYLKLYMSNIWLSDI